MNENLDAYLQPIDSIELIEMKETDVNPLIAKVNIKVFYLGESHNRTYVDKPVAIEMAKTLRGCPIIGQFDKEQEDFTDHGEVLVMDHKGFRKEIKTVPYGFIDLNAKIWFADFNEVDEKNRDVIRTYLVTEGYIWLGQYPELKTLFDGGRPQSMELDKKTLQGYWTKVNNGSVKIFIINSAIFSKLCILGENVEPCFEGASITPIDVNSTFTFDKDFTMNLYSMMKQLKEFTLSNQEGGNSMVEPTEAVVEETSASEFAAENQEPVVENTVAEEPTITEFKKDDNKEEEKETSDKEEETPASDKEEETSNKEKEDDKEEKKPKGSHSLHSDEDYEKLAVEFTKLQAKFAAIEAENVALRDFKNGIEDEKKTELINNFYMLSDEDKQDVITNKAKYTLDEIEAKLSVLCVRKKVNFNLEEKQEEEKPAITFNLESEVSEVEEIPAWLKAVEKFKESKY